MTVEKKARLINKYLKEKDYDNAYYQLENYDVATLNGKKTKETKNIIRKLAYKTAEKLYRRDPGKVIELYKIALHHTYSYSSKDYFTFEYLNADFIKSTPFAEWEQEGEANAPCYYIAYNLACIHAIRYL